MFVQLANGFAVKGLAVDLLLAAAQGPYLNEVSSAVRIVELGGSSVLRSLPGLVRYLRAMRPAALLSALEHSNSVAWLACRLSGVAVRCVLSIRAVPSSAYSHDQSVLRSLILKIASRIYPRADGVIANSRFTATELIASMGIAQQRMFVIHNPLDIVSIESSSVAPAEHAWLEAQTVPLILGVGRLNVLKDFPTLIRAFARVRERRECKLAILGEGPLREKLASLIGSLGIGSDVCLAGFVPNPYVWMARSRVFVSSSLTEGCPNALMQAMACGTAVVATDCPGGTSEVLESGRWGRLVPVGNVDAMAEGIIATLDSSSLPDVRRRARAFDLGSTVDKYLQVLLLDVAVRGMAA